VSLSGNLGFVPIDEVLRLLTRSNQQGSVDVTGSGLRGRIFVGRGGIDLATTWDDTDLHRHLINSGFTDDSSLRRIDNGETTLAAIAESSQEMVELLREMTVESLYQIGHRGDEFRVREGATTPYASPKSFELEALIEDAKGRERDWEKVAEIIPDLTGSISFRRDLGEREEVTVKVEDWKVLSEIGTGASVTEIADHLGTTEFWTARVAARLVSNELVVLGTPSATAETGLPTVPAPVWDDDEPLDETVEEYEETPVTGYETVDEGYAPAVTQGPADEYLEDDKEDADADESWWQEPEAETEEDTTEDTATRTPEVVAEGLQEIPSVDTEPSDVEEDTEAFLEKVFSELDSSEPEAEEGHGLLRRRRMGTLRDFSSDS